MKYTVGLGSYTVMYVVTKFHKNWFGHPEVEDGASQTHR
jgi:hypothetical protein